MEETIRRIDEFTSTHKQKLKGSKVYIEIQEALKCSLKEAKAVAKVSCNILSTYALLYGLNLITMSFTEFILYLLENGDINKDDIGWIKSEKEDIFKRLGLDIQLVRYTDIYGLPEGIYQVKIQNRFGTHFIAGYVINGLLYLSDTSWRGTHVEAAGVLKDDTVLWVKRYEHA